MNLLSCPFCGGSNLNNHASFMGFIGCDSCHTLGPNPQGSNDHITAWNTRTPPPTVWHRASEKLPTAKDGDWTGKVWIIADDLEFPMLLSTQFVSSVNNLMWTPNPVTKPKPPEV